jgi:hypothetical protein
MAVAALVLGICSLVVFPLAIVLGPLAIVYGVKAQGRIRRSPPGTPGQGMAITGTILGSIAILVGITIVLAAVVFVLVSNLCEAEAWDFTVDASGPGGVLTVAGYPGFPDWSEFSLDGSAACRLPSGSVDYGDAIVCTSDGTVVLLDGATGVALYNATV